ncbi:MAG: hypothetical protein AAGF58_08940 [Pseudomonadota bacterium]
MASDCPPLADSYPSEPDAFASLLDGTNICKSTFLATDYLNNFNELVMLFGLLADMPEVLDEIRDWQALSYIDHFEQSGFPYRELAIAGWHRADSNRREALDEFVDVSASLVEMRLAELEGHLATGDMAAFTQVCEEAKNTLNTAHDWATGLIIGRDGLEAKEIDRLLGTRVV